MAVMEYDLAELLENPTKPLTKEQKEHFEEYMAFKNHDIPAGEVDISEAVDDIIADFDYYCGFTKTITLAVEDSVYDNTVDDDEMDEILLYDEDGLKAGLKNIEEGRYKIIG